MLEALLTQLLEEVSVPDAMGHVSHRWCAGCKGKSRQLRACVAARQFLGQEESGC